MGQWRHYTEHKVKISAAYSTYKTKIDQKRTQYGFKRLLSCVEGQKDQSAKNKRADHFHYQTLWKNVKREWMGIAIQNRVETTKVVKIRNMLHRKQVSK